MALEYVQQLAVGGPDADGAVLPRGDDLLAVAAERRRVDGAAVSLQRDDQFALVMDANGTMLRIVRVGAFTPFPFTILGWQVTDIDQTVSDLTAKGLTFQRYTFLDQSPSGVWTAPGTCTR